jgi:hypothetical protein
MTPWKPSDGLCGIICLPNDETRAAYGDACRAAIIESAAKHAIGLGSLQDRRAFIDRHPSGTQETLKKRIKELWDQRNGASITPP